MSASCTCPTCGAAIDCGGIDPRALVAAVPAGPTCRKYIDVLADRFGRWVSIDALVDLVYGARPDGGPLSARNNISVYRHNSRARLAAVGLTIESRGAGGDLGFHRMVRL